MPAANRDVSLLRRESSSCSSLPLKTLHSTDACGRAGHEALEHCSFLPELSLLRVSAAHAVTIQRRSGPVDEQSFEPFKHSEHANLRLNASSFTDFRWWTELVGNACKRRQRKWQWKWGRRSRQQRQFDHDC